MSEHELEQLVTSAARGGSVSAMRLLREMLGSERKGKGDKFDFIDELAVRASVRRGSVAEAQHAALDRLYVVHEGDSAFFYRRPGGERIVLGFIDEHDATSTPLR